MSEAVGYGPLTGNIPASQLAQIAASERPILLVVCDTEEEFPWSDGFSPHNTAVSAMAQLSRGQQVFDQYNIKPCYVADYPVVNQPEGARPLIEIYQDGRCEIGAHLHPWVTPPKQEAINPVNSYAGNLPAALEEAKLVALNEAIARVFGQPATTFKAGRYGVGPNTGALLEKQGFNVDLSIFTDFDLTADGGPDFRGYPAGPYWFGQSRRLLSVPSTASVVGPGERLRLQAMSTANHPALLKLRLPGVLSRIGLADRLNLSNENYSLKENIKLTRWLLARGVRVFSYSFHSPSLKPGCTPYVQNERELRSFLDQFRAYFDYFFGELNGITMSPGELYVHLQEPAGQ